MTLTDVIDLQEAARISGWCLRRLHDFVKDGTIKARRTGGSKGTWITTRREAERLKQRTLKQPRGRKKRVVSS